MTRRTCRLTLVCLGTLLGVLVVAFGAAAQDRDIGWPREIDAPEGTIVIYQPQVESFEGDKLQARAAVSVTPTGSMGPVFGAAWVTARVLTDRDARTVSVLDVKVLRAKFPNATAEQEKRFAEIVEEAVPNWDLTISLDRLLTSLQTLEKERAAAESMKNAPPEILHVTYPAVLVTVDGEPQLRPVEGSKLMRVVNTPFLVVFDPRAKSYYLSGSDVWYTATDMKGLWEVSREIPPEVQALVTIPSGAPSPSSSAPSDTGMPRIIVATEPTELLITEGDPTYSPLGTDLLYVNNTESDVILEIATQEHYVLLSGRWYKSKSLDGPWEHVSSEDLPSGFADIPSESAKGHILAHVAGTRQAEEAVMDAQIPQTAAVKRSEATLEVTYDGEPKFERIEGTSIHYAVNTSSQVLYIEGKYYACEQGVWFVSKRSTGPWVVADSIPADVQEIPPSSPVYNVKYVYVYDSTPDVVYVGYTPGYVGCYPYRGVVVYGTGYYYAPWVGTYCYARPATWGFHAHYSSVTGGWTFGLTYSTPFVSAGVVWGDSWHHHGHHHGWWGAGGYHPHYGDVDIDIGEINIGSGNVNIQQFRQGQNNIYNRRGDVVRTGDITGERVTQSARLAEGRSNNIFADADGGIYRRTETGWQKREGTNWSAGDFASTRSGAADRAQSSGQFQRPSGTQSFARGGGLASLERDYSARQRGTARTNSFERQRSGSVGGRAGRTGRRR